jgi:chromosome segregation ATPase
MRSNNSKKSRTSNDPLDFDVEIESIASNSPNHNMAVNSPITIGVLTRLLKSNTKSINDKLDQKFDSLGQLISEHNVKINELETEVHDLRETVSKVSIENEQLWKEVNKLIIFIQLFQTLLNQLLEKSTPLTQCTELANFL